MPAIPSCTTHDILDHLTPVATLEQAADLRTYLAEVPDPRYRRGARHPLTGLRNLAISALRLADHTNIANALRAMSRDTNQPLTLLGIRS